MQLIVNNKEIKNPAVKTIVGFIAVCIVAAVLFFVFIIFLPLLFLLLIPIMILIAIIGFIVGD